MVLGTTAVCSIVSALVVLVVVDAGLVCTAMGTDAGVE